MIDLREYHDTIKKRLVYDDIKGLIFEYELACIHTLEFYLLGFFLVLLRHVLDASDRAVNAGDHGVSLLEHFLGESRVAAPRNENLGVGLDWDERSDGLLERVEALVPVEGLAVSEGDIRREYLE